MKRFLFVWCVTMPMFAGAQSYSWVQQAGGAGIDESYCVFNDVNQNTYITGIFSDSAVFATTTLVSGGDADLFIAKYDAAGNLIWVNQAGAAGNQGGHVLTVDAAGNVYVAGEFEGSVTFGANTLTSSGLADVYVVKYNGAGALQWTFKFGGTGNESANSIETDVSGNIFITGSFENVCAFGPQSLTSLGSSDIFIAKMSGFGGLNWVVKAGGIFEDEARGLAVAPNGEVCITGFFQDVATFGVIVLNSVLAGKEVFVARINTGGVFQWAVKGGGTENDQAYEADADSAGNFYITGAFRGTASFGTFNLASAGEDDVFVARVAPNGNFSWAVSAGGPGYDRGYAVTFSTGTVFVTGSFESTASFGGNSILSAGDKDVFIAALSSSGSFQWAWREGGSGFDRGYGIEANAAGTVWVTGVFEQNFSFGATSLTSNGMSDLFIARFGTVTSLPETFGKNGWAISPNPVGSYFMITGLDKPAVCRLYDMAGALVLETHVMPGISSVSIPVGSTGPFIVRLTDGLNTFNKVLVTCMEFGNSDW